MTLKLKKETVVKLQKDEMKNVKGGSGNNDCAVFRMSWSKYGQCSCKCIPTH
jgi:natural product precursor